MNTTDHDATAESMVDIGVIHGRFQVLHNDHLKYILAGKARCRHLIVGITNPDPTLTKADDADPERSGPRANPLTFYERQMMIREALREAGVPEHEFSIVPFPVNFPELYHHYVPSTATFFLTIYDDWGRRKREMFQTRGLKTEVLWERPLAEKGLSGSHIRRLIASGQPWEHLVPKTTAALVKTRGIEERLRG